MPDVVDKQTRSRMMSNIRGKNTKPELLIRRALHGAGFRYRLHDRRLPGKPDLVLPKYNAVVLVNGCFWHGHDCHLFRWPSSRQDWWHTKIGRTVETDRRNTEALTQQGWRIAVIWECALKGRTRLSFDETISTLTDWLRNQSSPGLEICGTEAGPSRPITRVPPTP